MMNAFPVAIHNKRGHAVYIIPHTVWHIVNKMVQPCYFIVNMCLIFGDVLMEYIILKQNNKFLLCNETHLLGIQHTV